MASMPARQASQLRSSPESEHTTSPAQTPSPTTRSEDSETVLLNAPTASDNADSRNATTPRRAHPEQEEEDVKKCWICFADETEDTAESSQWRSPCPCALVAHEECLLDWIADMESPSSRKRTLRPPQLLCPQCKTEIHLARPRDPIVELVRATERIAAKVATPVALSVVGQSIWYACWQHGLYTVSAIFGPEDSWRILGPAIGINRWEASWSMIDNARWLRDHWRLHLGLPLITPMLILSRTHYANSVLPVLPIVFFATQGDPDQPHDFGNWPPSASMAVAVLPYLRSVYNAYYDRVWAQHEKRWLKEIQPRNGQTEAEAAENAADNAQDDNDAEEEGIFEVRIDGNIWEEWNDGEQNAAQGQAQQRQGPNMDEEVEHIRRDLLAEDRAPPFNAPPLDDDGQAAPPPQVPRHQPQPPRQPEPQVQQQERRLSISTTGLAQKILGALIFPTVASLSGEALKMILPTSWTTRPGPAWAFGARPKATGLLQEKWGRSIVGGCLFVVLKDAIMLYVRWRMAQQHRRRRVLDYDRKKGKVAGR